MPMTGAGHRGAGGVGIAVACAASTGHQAGQHHALAERHAKIMDFGIARKSSNVR
jgi:hypothetical protein